MPVGRKRLGKNYNTDGIFSNGPPMDDARSGARTRGSSVGMRAAFKSMARSPPSVRSAVHLAAISLMLVLDDFTQTISMVDGVGVVDQIYERRVPLRVNDCFHGLITNTKC